MVRPGKRPRLGEKVDGAKEGQSKVGVPRAPSESSFVLNYPVGEVHCHLLVSKELEVLISRQWLQQLPKSSSSHSHPDENFGTRRQSFIRSWTQSTVQLPATLSSKLHQLRKKPKKEDVTPPVTVGESRGFSKGEDVGISPSPNPACNALVALPGLGLFLVQTRNFPFEPDNGYQN